ncbi:MAG: dephospho-CoA kinase [Planctomycetes bacterium]|nr:dephospho-CoA kinase [Planctomycetota bacterium]
MDAPAAKAKLVVGLIGGMGSGKSRVAAEFARHGARVVAGDPLGHEGLRQPELREQVVQRWGPGVLGADGEIDRRKLAAKVFADPVELRALERILFPWIERRLAEEIDRAQHDPTVSLIVVDAAVMLEAGWDRNCDLLVYVHAPRDERWRRLAQQRGWNAKEVEEREQAQLPLTEKVRRADVTVDNSGSAESLARQVADLLGRWGLPTGT